MAFNKETGMWEGFIYCIKNLINGKRYIGQTIRTINIRWCDHKCNSRKDNPTSPIGRAMKKYGIQNFMIYQIIKIEKSTKQEMISITNDLEKKYIFKLNTFIYYGNGYNIEIGGGSKGGKYVPIISYDLNGNILNKFYSVVSAAEYYNINWRTIYRVCNGEACNYNYQLVFRYEKDPFDKFPTVNNSKHHTTINNNVDDLIDGCFDPNHQQKLCVVDVYDKSTFKYIDSFSSIKECSDILKISRNGISKVCKGKAKTVGNYIVRYHGDSLEKYDYKPKTTTEKRRVNQYTKDGIFVDSFDSIYIAGIKTKSSRIHIGECCRGLHKSHNGFQWYYGDDDSQPDKSKIIV